MSEVTISSGSIEPYAGEETNLLLRVYARRTFTPVGGPTIVKGQLDSDNFYKEVECTVSAGSVAFPSFTLEATEDATPNNSYYMFALYTTDGVPVGLVYKKIFVPESPSTTTLPTLAAYSLATPATLPNTYYTANYIDQLFAAAISLAVKATTAIFGAVKLSAPAVSAGDPIVVAENDPVWRGIKGTKYLESYASLSAALSAIGSTRAAIRITGAVTVSADTTIPSTLLVEVEGEGKFTVATTKTLTINSLKAGQNRQIFFSTGTGKTVLGKNAASVIEAAWWTGISNSGDIANQMSHIWTSLTNNSGGRLRFGPGVWKFMEFTPPSNTIIEGSGRSIYDTDATVLYFNDPGPSIADDKCVIRIVEDRRNIVVKDCTITAASAADGQCVIMSGETDRTQGIVFENCVFRGTVSTLPQVELKATIPGWECLGIYFKNCFWETPANGTSLKFGSINSSVVIDSCGATVGNDATVVDADRVGFLEVRSLQADCGSMSASAAGNRSPAVLLTADVTSGSPIITITGVGEELSRDYIGQPFTYKGTWEADIIDVNYDGTTWTATASENAPFTATGEELDIQEYFQAGNGGYAVVKLGVEHGTVVLTNCADEGFQNFLVVNASSYTSPITLIGNLIQSFINLAASCTLDLWGNDMRSQSVIDSSGVLAKITSHGDHVRNTTLHGVTLSEPRLLGPREGISTLEAGNRKETPTEFFQGPEWEGGYADSTPWLNIGSHSASKILLWVGLLSDIGKRLHGYSLQRDSSTGFLKWTASQVDSVYAGYTFDAPIGYNTGGNVTQATSKATAVTLSKPTGEITLNGAALAAHTPVSFAFNNTYIDVNDGMAFAHASSVGVGKYSFIFRATGSGTGEITVTNLTAGSLSEAPVIQFWLLKGQRTA